MLSLSAAAHLEHSGRWEDRGRLLANFGQLCRWVVVVDRFVVRSIRLDALLKRSVVEAARFGPLCQQGFGLLPCRVQAIFERLSHYLPFWLSIYFLTVDSET